jgi:hypothetical protein
MSVTGPSDLPVGDVVEAVANGAGPGCLNLLLRYRLAPGERIRLALDFRGVALRAVDRQQVPSLESKGWERLLPERLTVEEQSYYLRSSPLVVVDSATTAEAARIAGGMGGGPPDVATLDDFAALSRLYAAITSGSYTYSWPPRDQGSAAMQRERNGDCGGFSFLLAAWCRSLGIPARVMVGSWARGANQAHVWNEVFLEGCGWVPVDAAHRFLLRGAMREAVERGAAGNSAAPGTSGHLGWIDDERLIFSVDADPHGLPGYPAAPPKEPRSAMFPVLGGREVRWGRELLEGTVPYLQPAYPHFHSDPAVHDDRIGLGEWRFSMPATRMAVNSLAVLALAAGAAAVAVSSATGVLAALAAFAAARWAASRERRYDGGLPAHLRAGIVRRMLH